jgi:hypothetical protein
MLVFYLVYCLNFFIYRFILNRFAAPFPVLTRLQLSGVKSIFGEMVGQRPGVLFPTLGDNINQKRIYSAI